MKVLKWLESSIPEPIKVLLRPIRNLFVDHYAAELSFWKSEFEEGNGVFKNEYYRRLMLAMAEQDDDEFLTGKIVADLGCGPKGSLVWAKSASLRIGIDVCHSAPQVYQACCSTFVPPKTIVSIIS